MVEVVSSRPIRPELRERYESEGWWTAETLGALLSDALAAQPQSTFRVHSNIRPYTGTFRDVERVARRLAAGLQTRGVGPGDFVAFQLPNWMEAAATFWASTLLGAVVVPIVGLVATDEPSREQNVHGFDDLLAHAPLLGTLDTDPSNPALIAFTSGTTRDPKGVVHSHQTLGCEIRQLNAGHPKHPAGQVTALPVGHFIGMLGGLLCPVLEGVPIHLCDAWDPSLVLKLMTQEGVGFGGGPAYFITSLLDHPDFTEDHLQHMRYLGLGGSAIPITVTRRLTDLGLVVTRSYGSTEHPSITGSSPTAAEDKRLLTDGAARSGVEVRLASDGEILSRGPDLCLGYLDSELSAKAFDDDGWYHTGDIGVLDEDGYLTITDRKSDVIIRGGENISAIEVEEALLAMPEVAEAVVVAAPDERFGERVVAVLRIRPGSQLPSRDRVREHFQAAGLARQKWPEDLREVDDYPRTPSGKVQKYLVRQQVRSSQ